MVILDSGETFGMVSGGCLEADVLERAQKVLRSEKAEVFTYDTTNDENSVFSLNMGCRGVVRILLEPVNSGSQLIGSFKSIRRGRKRQAVATLISGGPEPGGRIYFRGRNDVDAAGLPASLEHCADLIESVERFFCSGESYDFTKIESSDESYEFAFESLLPPVSMLIFGAGTDAIPVAKIAAGLGWEATVLDHRRAFLTPDRFDIDDVTLTAQTAEDPSFGADPDKRTAAIVMTHNYARDRQLLPFLLNSNAFYVGALGPKKRTQQLLSEITSVGNSFTDEQLERLFAPAGLDIGADSPEAIALSIIAEIQSVLRARSGGPLRDRKGSIYDRK